MNVAAIPAPGWYAVRVGEKYVDNPKDWLKLDDIIDVVAKVRADGAEEAWRFIRSIGTDDTPEFKWDIALESLAYFRHNTYAEARKAFDAWKAEQDKPWEPKVGDVVTDGERKAVIVGIRREDTTLPVNLLMNDGEWHYASYDEFGKEGRLRPTGETIDLSEIFDKLKGEEE